MYKNRSNPGTQGDTSLELSKIVEGVDVFNSELLYKITKFPEYKLMEHEVKFSGLDPNSVSNEIYGNHKYSWILILFNPELPIVEYSVGDKIKYPKLTDLRSHLKL